MERCEEENGGNNNNNGGGGGDGDRQKSKSPQVMPPKNKKSKKGGRRIENSCNCEELRYVECILETKDLWDKFHDLETEMIITKTGR